MIARSREEARTPTADRWAVIETAFAQARSLPENGRRAFLAALTHDDPELASEVRSLLATGDPWWLDEPVVRLPRAPSSRSPAST